MPTTPSPLRYPGGKTAYAPMLREIIRKNGLEGCEYVEPFAGGAGAAVTLLLENTVQRIWLNDFDFSIYAFWKAILDHTDDFLARLRRLRISMAEWRRQRAIYFGGTKNILDRGFAAFYLNRCNHAGILAANPVGGLSQKGAYRIDARFKKDPLEKKIKTLFALRDRIKITYMDAAELLARYRPVVKNTLVYLDPPYYKKGDLLYMNHFRHEDHASMSKTIRSCRTPWVLSYDNQPEILRLYRGVRAYRQQLNYSISTPSVGTELVFSRLAMPDGLESSQGASHADMD
jgi:DNA adenine methylase